MIFLQALFPLFAQDSDRTPGPAVRDAVEAVFPQDLRYAKEPASENPYGTCAAVFSWNADGTPDLIATAYHGDGAEIAMIAYTPSGARILSAVTNQQFWLTSGECDLSIDNLSDPTHPDSLLSRTIYATFDGSDWLFTWDGTRLKNITALGRKMAHWRGKDVPASVMNVKDIVDIDHRGAMQVISPMGGWDKFPDDDGIMSTGTDALYRYNGSTFAWAKTFLYFEEIEPQPLNWSESMNGSWANANIHRISMHKTPAPNYQLRIVNGDRDGSNRVTSANIEINGVTIVLANDINQSMETLTRTIQLQKENKIKVTVDGAAKSHIYVMVE